MGILDNKIKIYTLGEFKVEKNSEIITSEVTRMSKIWKMFQYLFTFKNRDVSREELIQVLDLNKNDAPEGALTALVYRLRKNLNKQNKYKSDRYILTRGRAYTFNDKSSHWFDADEFVNLNKKTERLIKKNSIKACDVFNESLELYKGNYLEYRDSEEWIWSARNKYRDILISTLMKLDRFLSQREYFEKLWQFYDQIQEVISFDEDLISGSIEALLGAGKVGLARKKYNEAVSLYENNNLNLPPNIKELKNRFQYCYLDDPTGFLKEIIKQDEISGAFVSKPERFPQVLELEKRRAQRDNSPRVLVHLEITGDLDNPDLKASVCERILNILKEQLRAGDIISRWSECHFVILLTNIKYEKTDKLINRIKKSFAQKNTISGDINFEETIYEF